MNVKKFTAPSSREALRKVREALGPDAVILSNRATDNGVEVLALANDDISSLAAPSAERDLPPPDLSHFPAGAQVSTTSFPAAGGNLPSASARRPSAKANVTSMAQSLEMARLAQQNPPQEAGFAGQAYGVEFDADEDWDEDADGYLERPERERGFHERALKSSPERFAERAREMDGERARPRLDERMQDRIPERAVERTPQRPQERVQERVQDRASERQLERQPERQFERTERTPERGLERAVERSAERQDGSEMAAMMREIRAMRGMMETQLAELAWHSTQKREPQKAQVLRELLAAGFSPSLSRYLTEKLPQVKDEGEGLRWIKTVLERNIATVNNEHEILEKGGVFALVGPTGVGKTTSTAKLAARCVMRHGTEKLALITTDGYRIGGHEQLRIYGKILGVMVHSVKDEADLRIALRELRGKHTVLIDTIGVSQRDHMVQEQVAMLSSAGPDVQRLLCLNATSTGETLYEVVRAYQGTGLAGCIMTKVDEAATIGNVLDVVIRQKLQLYYVSNGQRVPEDLHLAERAYLLERAFHSQRETQAFQYQDGELPLIMANSRTMDNSLREVHLG